MRNSYMPSKQADQVLWAQTFVNVVGPKAEEYGVPAALMTQFSDINNTLQNLWTTASEPSTRTRGVVAAKNNALKEMKLQANHLNSIIQGMRSVTDQMKIDAGLTVRDKTPTPSPVPSQEPFIKVKKVKGRTVTIQLCQDQETRGKPAKVKGATIFTYVGPVAPENDDVWKFVANTTRTTVQIPFGPSTTGDTVWITAFWNNSRDESGPATDPPVMVNLPAGGVLPTEAEMAKMKAA